MIKEVLQQLEPLDAQIDALCSRADDAEMASTTTHAAELAELSAEEKAALVKEQPAYGRVICRCETITEGEILAALHSEVPANTIDGVKRRAGAGMGRCQGGFCGPRVLELISRELGIDPLDILQDKNGSNVLLSETKVGGKNNG